MVAFNRNSKLTQDRPNIIYKLSFETCKNKD